MPDLASAQRELAHLLRTLPTATASPELTPAAGGEDGLRIASLLIAKLRFSRLIQGSRRAGQAFDTDPASLVDAFRTYHAEVASPSSSPNEEAATFEAWMQRTGQWTRSDAE